MLVRARERESTRGSEREKARGGGGQSEGEGGQASGFVRQGCEDRGRHFDTSLDKKT